MIRRFAHWRAHEARLSAADLYLEAQFALLIESDPVGHDRLALEAEELRHRAIWWDRVADWRRERRALLYDDPEVGS